MKMKFRPQLKAVAWGVSLALMISAPAYAGGWGAPAQGDSGQGVDTVLGNGLNPRGLDNTVQPDENGLGPFRAPVAHTPTGSLYSIPWTEPTDPAFIGNIELGYIGSFGDRDAAKFIEYRDFSGIVNNNNGIILNNFNFASEKGKQYFNFFGGGVSNADRYYGFNVGEYNDWRLRVFYNETPHVFTTTARLIWDGAGSSNLVLKPALAFTRATNTAAGATQNPNAATLNTTLRNVVANSPDTTLALYRKKGGFRYDAPLSGNSSFYFNYSLEKRSGSRQWGQTGGGFSGAGLANANATNGQPLQMVEPISYNTHDFRTGWSFADAKNALNVSFAASVFEDNIKRVIWENPDSSPFNNTTTGQVLDRHLQHFTTPPSNQAYYLNLDYSRALGFWKSNFTTNLSYGLQKQDDQLQPYTVAAGYTAFPIVTNPGLTGGASPAAGVGGIANVGGVDTQQNDLRYWNSLIGPNGLPTTTRSTADLKNKVYNATFGFNAQPVKNLTTNAKLRYYEVKQENDYLACNPSLAAAKGVAGACDNPALAGNQQIYGFLVEDGNAQGVVAAYSTGAGIGGAVRSLRAGYKQVNFSVGGDYRVTKSISLNADLGVEQVTRHERERDKTNEFKLKLGFVDRSLFGGTLRTSYEYDDRGGSTWKMNGYFESSCAYYEVDPSQCYAVTANGGNGLATYVNGTTGALSNTARPPEGGKHDLADRKQHILVVRYNKLITETLDVMVTGRSKNEIYPEDGTRAIGRDARRDNTLSLEANWQPSTVTSVFGYATYQKTAQSQWSLSGNSAYNATTNPLGCSQALFLAGGCNAVIGAAGSIYNNPGLINFFRYQTDDKNLIFGTGLSHKTSFARFDANYQFTRTSSPMSYVRYNPTNPAAPLAAPNTNQVVTYTNVAGVGALPSSFKFPAMEYNRHQLNLNVTVPVGEKLALRGLYMFDRATIKDWHYDGLDTLNNVTGLGRYYLGNPAPSYTAHVVALFAQYKL